jgi:hypothetical protein
VYIKKTPEAIAPCGRVFDFLKIAVTNCVSKSWGGVELNTKATVGRAARAAGGRLADNVGCPKGVKTILDKFIMSVQ